MQTAKTEHAKLGSDGKWAVIWLGGDGLMTEGDRLYHHVIFPWIEATACPCCFRDLASTVLLNTDEMAFDIKLDHIGLSTAHRHTA